MDVALRIGELPDSSLIATRLGSVRRLVCAAPDYLAANGVPKTPNDLVRHSVISFDSVSSPTTESEGSEITTSFRSRLSVNTIDAAIDAGLGGAGLIRTNSYQVEDHVRSGRLAIVLDAFEPAPWPVHLVYDMQNRLPLKLRAFVDFAVPRLRERLTHAAL